MDVTPEAPRWSAADESALTWPHSVENWPKHSDHTTEARQDRVFVLHPLTERRQDRVFVLHPLTERVDGEPFKPGQSVDFDSYFLDGWPDNLLPFFRRLSWRDYANRKEIPLMLPGHGPDLQGALPGVLDDEYVVPPEEGSLDDRPTWEALMGVLIAHSPEGGDTPCTVWFEPFWLGDSHEESAKPPHILRGPLGAHLELFHRDGYALTPQNLWPDDHRWQIETDVDSWATIIHGPTELINSILASPDLEVIRLDDARTCPHCYSDGTSSAKRRSAGSAAGRDPAGQPTS